MREITHLAKAGGGGGGGGAVREITHFAKSEGAGNQLPTFAISASFL